MKPALHPRSSTQRAFTLIELLVVIAIIAILAGLLMPALARAKQRVQITRCLNNLHQICVASTLYADDYGNRFLPGTSQQFDRKAQLLLHGNAPGGKDPLPSFLPEFPPATNRLLWSYARTPEGWHCPADAGLRWTPADTESAFDAGGTSYRFNWILPDNYRSMGIADAPDYNLSGKLESWVPDPARFIMFHEYGTYPWSNGQTGENVWMAQWHYSAQPGKMFDPGKLRTDRDKFVAPFGFVDGHAQQCDLTKTFQSNPQLALEPGKDWMWYKSVR